MVRSGFVTLLGIALLAVAGATAQDREQYSERLEFDARTGQWIERPPPIPGTEAGDLALARSMLAGGRYKDAREAFEQWFESYPDSMLWPEALFYAAETEIAAVEAEPKGGDLMKAYEWLESLLEGWRGHALADRAVRREIIIAEMLLYKNRKQRVFKGLLWLSGEKEAMQMLDRVIDFWAPATPIAEHALRLKADYHFQNGEFDEAELAYARLMREYPRGKHHKLALLRSGRSALARFPGVHFDEADLLEAEVYFKDFEKQYPKDAAADQVPQVLDSITEKRAEKEYTVGEFYERIDKLDAASYYYRWVVAHYPATTWAQKSRERLIAIGAEAPDAESESVAAGLATPE